MAIRKRTWTLTRKDKETGEPVTVERTAWQLDYVDQHNKRRRKHFPRQKDAQTWWDTHGAVSVREGTHVTDSETITVSAAADLWLRDCATAQEDAPPLEAATLDQYKNHVKLHILPFLGKEKLTRLNVATVRAFEVRLAEEGRSPALVKKVVSSLGALIETAKDYGKVGQNPVRERRKRRRKRRQSQRHKPQLEAGVDFPTKEELKAIIEHATGRWRPLIITAIFTGLRASELRGLTWKNVDLKKHQLRVAQRADKYNKIGPPKSATSRRTVPLGPMVVNTLREWKLQCPPGDLVFPTGAGKIEHLKNIHARGLGPTQYAAGLCTDKAKPKYGLHAFRHAAASRWIKSKEFTPKEIQSMMGHSTITMTFDTYGHLFPKPEEDAAAMARAEADLIA